MRVAIDTNRYTDFARGDKHSLEILEGAEQIFVPLIVLAELRAGFACGSRAAENERSLIKFLNAAGVQVLYPDEQTTHQYARLFSFLRKHGTPIPTNDIWIAALVAQHDLILFARDKYFSNLPQIPLIL